MSTDCSSRCCTVIIYTHTHTHTAAVCHVVHGTADNGPLYLAKSSIDYECAYNNIVTTSPRHLRFVHRGFDNGTVRYRSAKTSCGWDATFAVSLSLYLSPFTQLLNMHNEQTVYTYVSMAKYTPAMSTVPPSLIVSRVSLVAYISSIIINVQWLSYSVDVLCCTYVQFTLPMPMWQNNSVIASVVWTEFTTIQDCHHNYLTDWLVQLLIVQTEQDSCRFNSQCPTHVRNRIKRRMCLAVNWALINWPARRTEWSPNTKDQHHHNDGYLHSLCWLSRFH